MRRVLGCGVLLFLGLPCLAQKDHTEDWKNTMQLLPGYKVIAVQGIDSIGGKITKPGGVTIRFEMYGNAGNHADSEKAKKETLWRTEQTLKDGSKVICVYEKSKRLIVAFPPSVNFFANIRNQKDLADMLLMVMTFHDTARDSAKPLTQESADKRK